MGRQSLPDEARRTVRFVLLLTPGEATLLATVAAQELRSRPDFLRTCIIYAARGMNIQERNRDAEISKDRVSVGLGGPSFP